MFAWVENKEATVRSSLPPSLSRTMDKSPKLQGRNFLLSQYNNPWIVSSKSVRSVSFPILFWQDPASSPISFHLSWGKDAVRLGGGGWVKQGGERAFLFLPLSLGSEEEMYLVPPKHSSRLKKGAKERENRRGRKSCREMG